MNRNTPEDLVRDLIHKGLNNSLACDEDGFVTLTDKEGNSYVAQTNKEERDRYESTGKKLSQVKKEEKEKAGKSESEQDLTRAEIKKKLKNLYERAKKELHKELRKKSERTTGERLSDEEIEKRINDYEKNDVLKYVSDKPVFRLISNLNNAKKITPNLLKDVKDFFSKNKLSMAQDSALEKYFDNLF